jgi:hypothetical protein
MGVVLGWEATMMPERDFITRLPGPAATDELMGIERLER